MRLLTIKEICEKKEIPIKKVAEQVGMSEQNFHRCIRINKMDGNIIEMVATVLKVPITTFFDENPDIVMISTNKSDNNEHDKKLIENKDREIELLKQMIQDKNDIIALLKSRDARMDDSAICAGAGGRGA